MSLSDRPRVSVVIAARNEQRHIEQAIRSVVEGSLPPQDVEVLVVDGGSTDSTRQIVQRLGEQFPNVRLLDNPRQITPAGFNIGIEASRAPAICILSGHSYVDRDYLQRCLETLDETGADVVGGPMKTLQQAGGLSGRLVSMVLASRFGVGGSFRTVVKEGPVDTVVFGVYRRSVFQRVGLFDERLVRNQDNELNSRLRSAGGVAWMVPSVQSYYYARATLRKLLSQNFRNGLYGILTWRINPASFALRHAVPFGFVLFLLIGTPLSLLHPLLSAGFLGVLALYGILALVAAVETLWRGRDPLAPALLVMFPLLHIAYGLGTLAGVFRFGLQPLPKGKPEHLPPLT